MKYILILGVGDKIKEIINQGLEIILDTEHAITSIIIQLVATLLLFLAVRFLFWNKITAVIEEKENREKKAFEDLENAKKEAIELKKQIEIDTENAKQEGYKIIERAKQKSYAEAEEIVKKASSNPLKVTLTWTNLIFNEVLASYLPNDVIIKTDLNSISSDSGSVTLLIPQGSDFKLQFYATKATYSVSAKVEIYDVDKDVKSYVIYDKFFGGYTDSEITIKSDGASSNDSILVLNNTKQGLVH